MAAAGLAAAVLAGGAGATVTTTAARGSLPEHGILVPGVSLAGVRLGMTAAEVRRLLGSNFGRCRSCAWETWYYNRRPFTPDGLAVELHHGRVAAAFTLWGPSGWRTRDGVAIDDREPAVARAYPGVRFVGCGDYDVLALRTPSATTGFVILDGTVWGFILGTPRALLCR